MSPSLHALSVFAGETAKKAIQSSKMLRREFISTTKVWNWGKTEGLTEKFYEFLC